MKSKLTYAPLAQNDLARVRAWYSQADAGPKAKARVKAILDVIKALPRQPRMGAPWKRPGQRRIVVEEHSVIYRPEPIRRGSSPPYEIVRIYGPGQDLPE